MQTKLKTCKGCNKQKKIFSKGLCIDCDKKQNPQKYIILKKENIKKPKLTPLPKLKKKLDEVFSLYIRHKYAVNGMVKCYTCDVVKPIKEMQNGHYISRGVLATRFLEINCRPQCVGCNVFKHGNYIVYTRRLEEELGVEKVKKLEAMVNANVKFSRLEYEVLINDYTEKLNKLKANEY